MWEQAAEVLFSAVCQETMSRRLLFFLFTAALALMAAFLVRSALKSKEAKIQALQHNTVRIFVAARALSPGERVDASALRLVTWPREHIPPGAVDDLQAAVGKIVKTSFSANQPIVAAELLDADKTGGVLPLMIPEGMRAMSIAVNEVSDMAGFILPHSRVDVLVSIPIGGGSAMNSAASSEVTKIVLQDIEVLAVEQTLESGPDQPHAAKVVTLLVTPLQAERLAAASRLGTLLLAMRNFADQQQIVTSGVSVNSLLGAVLSEAPPAPAAMAAADQRVRLTRRLRTKSVEVIRNGKDHQTINFLADGRILPPAPSAPPPPVANPAQPEAAPPGY